MKTFKALYIDNGVIKAGEFPVEPDSCFLPFCETDGTDIEYCKCHELETEYERAMREAKANAVECENPQQARKLILFYNSKEVLNSACLADMKDGIYPLPSGWDWVVKQRVCLKDCDCNTPCEITKVAILYRTDEQTKIEELRKKLDAFLATQTKEQLEKWLEMDRERMKQPEPESQERTYTLKDMRAAFYAGRVFEVDEGSPGFDKWIDNYNL